MKKPNLFILGAPKCGTTSLAKWLSQHHDVYLPRLKEPYFFAEDLKIRKSTSIDCENKYNKLYNKAGNDKRIIIDASTGYLYSGIAVKKILSYCDESPKFILMFRNPVDMVQSLHSQIYYMTWEMEKSFERAWRLQSVRKNNKCIPSNCVEEQVLQYKDWCMLGEQYERFLKDSEEGDHYIIWFEDLVANPHKVYVDVLRYLNIGIPPYVNLGVYNSNKYYKNRSIQKIIRELAKVKRKMSFLGLDMNFGVNGLLNNMNSVKSSRKMISEEFRQELIDAFYDDIAKLEKLTGKPLVDQWMKN